MSKHFDRRKFMATTSAVAVAGGSALGSDLIDPTSIKNPMKDNPSFPRFVSTWKFGKPVNDAALATVPKRGQHVGRN